MTYFENNGDAVIWHKKFRVVEFGHEEIAGWRWYASLVMQRYGLLEPMLTGKRGLDGVGSTMLSLADDAGQLSIPPFTIDTPFNRPRYDGNMETMRQIASGLVTLFRDVKDGLRQHW